ncbi:MAG: 30S ribosomal protein S6 [Chloroflexi bacterium]|nr:30S ribosomal protein S6 [Chloroflexota bacterium]
MTRDYELVTVWNPDIGEEGVTGGLDRLKGAVASRGGEVADTNIWGRRRLAYKIDRHAEGVYVIQQLKLEPNRAAELEAQLRINEDVLRHLLVRKDE